MKKLLLLILLLAAGGGAWWWYQHNGGEAATYTTAAVTRGQLTQAVTATGTLNPVINVTIGSQISGNIQTLNADWNSQVKAGQVVAQLDPATYQAIKNQTDGDVALAEASLNLAKLTAKRKRDLVAQVAAPQADLDSAEAALLQAEATVRVKRAQLEKAKVDLDRCTIRSPIDGVVISRSVDVGQTVAASMNAPVLFMIANDLTKMQIDSNVAEADVGAVEENQAVEFTVDAFPNRTFRGTVAQVRNAATTVQNVVTYNVVVAVDNPDLKLKPGMTANVSIIVAQREDVLKVPNTALRFRMPDAEGTPPPSPATRPPGGGGERRRQTSGGPRPGSGRGERKVYAMPAGAAKPAATTVKLGISDGLTTEVLEGLKEGDLVVTGMSTPSKSGTPPPNPFGGGGDAAAILVMPAVIQLDAVSKVYRSGDVEVHAVRDVSLEIHQGEFVAIMGASGSGKSTMMNILGCLDRPTSGRYLLDGTDVSRLGRDALANIRNQKIGFVFQGFNLLSRTSALENVELPMMYAREALPAGEQRERAVRALEMVGLAGRAEHHPNQLSGGQQQRVAIARGLVNHPALLLADEPTGNLDSRTSIEIMDAFQELNGRGITIAMVTHEHDIAAYTKRNIVMRDGVIVKDIAVANCTSAKAELKRLDDEQKAVQLTA